MALPRERMMPQITNNICIQGKRKCSASDILGIWLHHNLCCSILGQHPRKLSKYAPYAAFILPLFIRHPLQDRILDYVKVQSDIVLWFLWQFGFVFILQVRNTFFFKSLDWMKCHFENLINIYVLYLLLRQYLWHQFAVYFKCADFLLWFNPSPGQVLTGTPAVEQGRKWKELEKIHGLR